MSREHAILLEYGHMHWSMVKCHVRFIHIYSSIYVKLLVSRTITLKYHFFVYSMQQLFVYSFMFLEVLEINYIIFMSQIKTFIQFLILIIDDQEYVMFFLFVQKILFLI